jgi:hypothetical protein
MFAAFNDGERPITTADLLAAAKSTFPMAKTAADRTKKLRDWQKGRAKLASTPEQEGPQKGPAIDID